MEKGNPRDDPAADVAGPEERVFTPETDELIGELKTLHSRWNVNPYMFGEPSAGGSRADRGQRTKLHDALVALRDRLRRRGDRVA